MTISRQNILELNEGKSPLGMHRDRRQMQQYDQNNRRGLGLVGYVMWKSDTKSAVQIQGSIWICLQCLHTLARSPCTGVCMLIGN